MIHCASALQPAGVHCQHPRSGRQTALPDQQLQAAEQLGGVDGIQRHTVPLLMAVGARLSARHLWLQPELVHYLEEEQGHDEWILSDIAAAGGDARAVRDGAPSVETDAMVAYAYDTVMRRNPVAFFGMVYVLEGTSVALALSAADAIQRTLKLPHKAFTYLRSHGALDQQHIGHLASIVDRFDAAGDLPAVVTCARAMFQLYGDVFRSLSLQEAA